MSNIYIKHNIPISYISWDKRGFAILSVCEGSSNALTFFRSKTFAFWVKFALSQFWWKWDFILAAFGGKFEQLATSALLLLHIAGKVFWTKCIEYIEIHRYIYRNILIYMEQLPTSALLLLHIAGKMGNGEYQIRKTKGTTDPRVEFILPK